MWSPIPLILLVLATPLTTATPSAKTTQLLSTLSSLTLTQSAALTALSRLQNLTTSAATDPLIHTAAKSDLQTFLTASAQLRANLLPLSSINPQITRALAALMASQAIDAGVANNLTGGPGDVPLLVRLRQDLAVGLEKCDSMKAMATGGPAPMVT
ncbi:hypothetical protein EJ06DRAFT_534870 [Trichodelitschia bisporula]|uniref:Cell wall protein n=1 Tax=Trichodelitschia bisporula TaxID=703511 RepID=A0A6G1HIK6_9PEZI|nr:hypothetical protein EJ06DRAFT_534870 [Trichodelitschia bisporula]